MVDAKGVPSLSFSFLTSSALVGGGRALSSFMGIESTSFFFVVVVVSETLIFFGGMCGLLGRGETRPAGCADASAVPRSSTCTHRGSVSVMFIRPRFSRPCLAMLARSLLFRFGHSCGRTSSQDSGFRRHFPASILPPSLRGETGSSNYKRTCVSSQIRTATGGYLPLG